MKQCSKFRSSARQSYGIFYFYYSSNDHDFFYQVHGSGILRTDLQSGYYSRDSIHFGYYEFLIVFSEPPTPGSIYKIWWTTGSASLTKRGSCSSHA